MLEIRLLNSTAESAVTIVVIEHRLKKPVTWETDDIATMLALSNEILHLKNPDARRDAFAEVMRREWNMGSTFRRAERAPSVALRGNERTGTVAVRAGVLFDEPAVAEFSWPDELPSYRLTALRVFLEALTRGTG
jgi:hypothetical protein